MEVFNELVQALPDYLPALGFVAVLALGLYLANHLLQGPWKNLGPEARLPRQLAMLVFTAVGLIMVLLALPMETDTRHEVLRLLGLVFTGVIGLSSTTFVSNAMAGFMSRSIKSFRPGDYVRVGDSFGRVTERGLFHTEIQSEDRDLITLPNLYLVTNPVKVVRKSGTLVSVRITLGYDVPSAEVESALKHAAGEVGLGDAFVHIKDLGDYAITYMVAGFLDDIDRLLTTRSRLRKEVLAALHGAGIEIVSPSFMNTRALPLDRPVISDERRRRGAAPDEDDEPTAEGVAFDKAARAAELDQLQGELAELQKHIKESAPSTPEEKALLDAQESDLRARIDELTGEIDTD